MTKELEAKEKELGRKIKISDKEWEDAYNFWYVNPGEKNQPEYKILEKELKFNKNVELLTSRIFSYQNQGNPTENDIVILVNGSDRYNYKNKGFELYEFDGYNKKFNLDEIKEIVKKNS